MGIGFAFVVVSTTLGCAPRSVTQLDAEPREHMLAALMGIPKSAVDDYLPEAATRASLKVERRPTGPDDHWILGRDAGFSTPGFWIRVDTVEVSSGTQLYVGTLIDAKTITWSLEAQAAQSTLLTALTAVAYERGGAP